MNRRSSLVQLLVGVMAVLSVIQTAPTAAHSQLTDISPTAISSMKASTTTFTIGGALSGSTAVLLLKTHAYIPTSATFPAYDCDNLPAPTELRSTENSTVDASSQVTFTTAGLLHGSYTLCFHNATVPVNTTWYELMSGVVTFPWRYNETNSSMTCWNHTDVDQQYQDALDAWVDSQCNGTYGWEAEHVPQAASPDSGPAPPTPTDTNVTPTRSLQKTRSQSNLTATCIADALERANIQIDYNVTCNMTIEWYEERWMWVDPPTAVEEFPMYPVAIAGPVHPKNSRVDCCGDFQVGNVYSCSILTFDDLGQLAGSTEEECQMGVCVKDGQNGVIYEPLKTVPTFTELGMFNFTFNATVSGCYGSAMGYIKDTPVNGGIAAHFKIAPGEIRGWASTAECSADPGVPCSVVNRDMWGNPVSKCGYDSTGTITCTGTIAD